jgi:2-haloacid dehalogenase
MKDFPPLMDRGGDLDEIVKRATMIGSAPVNRTRLGDPVGAVQPKPHHARRGEEETMGDRPKVLVFDVNETLSDTKVLAERFAEVGAPEHLAATWFAQILRDGFALTSAGDKTAFAAIAEVHLEATLGSAELNCPLDEAKKALLGSFARLPLHSDVAPGLTDLAAAGFRSVTLTNGAATVAGSLFEAAGLVGIFERLLSVDDAPAWKPSAAAYRWAADVCGVGPAEMMLVAAHPWDIHGATRAGLRTAWVNRANRQYPAYFARAELTVSSLTDLAQQLS